MSSSGSHTSTRPPPKPNVRKSHRLQRHIAGQDHQVGPGDLAAVLLLDRPQQPAGLVEVGVVGPAVERREAVGARAAAAPAVVDAVGAGAVPRHPDDQRPVVAVVGRPPVLGGGQHLFDVGLHGGEVEAVELGRVVEAVAHGVDLRRVLVQRSQVQLLGPTTAGWPASPWPWAPRAARGILRRARPCSAGLVSWVVIDAPWMVGGQWQGRQPAAQSTSTMWPQRRHTKW